MPPSNQQNSFNKRIKIRRKLTKLSKLMNSPIESTTFYETPKNPINFHEISPFLVVKITIWSQDQIPKTNLRDARIAKHHRSERRKGTQGPPNLGFAAAAAAVVVVVVVVVVVAVAESLSLWLLWLWLCWPEGDIVVPGAPTDDTEWDATNFYLSGRFYLT